MLTFSPSLKAILDTATTKIDWANKLQTALGNTRRLRCFRDANSAATDPATSGTEFLNVGSTGALTISSGNITSFGTLSNATVKQTADLSTGACVLRLEGNGYWVQGTLGLGTTTDFTFTSNFNVSVANKGIALTSGAGVKAPILLDSGTGPASPAATSNKPYDVLIEDWSSGSAVQAGVIPFNVTLPNMVFDDAEMQASMGDVKVYESNVSVTLGNMEFGAVMAGIHKGSNAIDVNEPIYEVLILRKPTSANWPNYPSMSGWSATTSDTIGDKPFKAKIRRQDGTVLYTHQMRDGLPINHPSLNQSEANVTTSALRPFFHCAGALPWRSHRSKQHLSAKKYYPGISDTRPLRGSAAHDISAANGSWQYGPGQRDGFLNWYMLPKWPQAQTTTIPADWPTADVYAGENYNNHYSWTARLTGWGYEPGSVSGHDQYCAAGGVRFDRAVMPTWYSLYMHDTTWAHPRNGDSIVDMKEAAEFGFYNLPNFFITNVKTGDGVPMTEVFNNQWAHSRTHYGPNDWYTDGGPAYAIPLFAKPATFDKNGRLVWGGAATDSLHNYWAAFWSVIFDNSAIGVLASKHRLYSSIMVQQGDVPDTKDPAGWFLTRQQAWRWMHLVGGWKISTDHKWGVPRVLLEKRFENELNAIYNYIVKPTMIDNNPAAYFTALRNLGNPIDSYKVQSSTSMTFYMTQVLQMMKAFGMWDAMRNKSATCKAALDFMVRCMDLMAVDYILDTTGYCGPSYTGTGYITLAKSDGSIATSWVDWKTNVRPAIGSEDWVHNPDGSIGNPTYATEVLRYQYVCMRRDWIKEAEIPCARANGINLAIAKYEAYMQIKDNAVAAATGGFNKMAADFFGYYPMYAPIKPAV